MLMWAYKCINYLITSEPVLQLQLSTSGRHSLQTIFSGFLYVSLSLHTYCKMKEFCKSTKDMQIINKMQLVPLLLQKLRSSVFLLLDPINFKKPVQIATQFRSH